MLCSVSIVMWKIEGDLLARGLECRMCRRVVNNFGGGLMTKSWSTYSTPDKRLCVEKEFQLRIWWVLISVVRNANLEAIRLLQGLYPHLSTVILSFPPWRSVLVKRFKEIQNWKQGRIIISLQLGYENIHFSELGSCWTVASWHTTQLKIINSCLWAASCKKNSRNRC